MGLSSEASVAERLGHAPSSRLLVIHADDFGMSHSVNRATAAAFESDWITSASVMVPCPWFLEAATFARAHPEACIGVHLTLNSEWESFRWGPVASRETVASLVDALGFFPRTEAEVVKRARPSDVEVELAAQVDRARASGIDVTHLDSHMMTLFRSPLLLAKYLELGRRNGIPVRGDALPDATSWNMGAGFRVVDAVLEVGREVPADGWLDAYRAKLTGLPPGSYQLTVHLGFDDDELRAVTRGQVGWGAAWRQRDFDLVRSAAFRSFVHTEGFVLVSWRELASVATAHSMEE